MPYKGKLSVQSAFDVEVSATGGNRDGVGVTVAFIVQSDKYSDVDVFTVPAPVGTAGSKVTKTYAPNTLPVITGKRVRVIVDVATPSPGGALVKVSQGGVAKVDDTVASDARFVLDLE